ncbi:L-threonylcarbamoyladenylate synthase [Halocatena marina]|uniref:L-threonylcarbamoyladenylate synthase n=1 Tax=Halocatena marina TaxID=2934937 RepID=UPI0020105D55|nr:L-threonylcarbamoyladenylate synthase [Halocatena marina]
MTVEQAATAIKEDGGCVIYPTETVYGLAADALNPESINRVFELKGRSRDNPISFAVPDIETVDEYTRPTDRERAFMRAFLPGPITVVLERRSGAGVPDVLTGGRERVGVRIPDHPIALDLLERVAPLTATSANRSGAGSARRVEEIAPDFRDAVDAILDDGETPGSESTVVDVSTDTIHRRGALANEIEAWLTEE